MWGVSNKIHVENVHYFENISFTLTIQSILNVYFERHSRVQSSCLNKNEVQFY